MWNKRFKNIAIGFLSIVIFICMCGLLVVNQNVLAEETTSSQEAYYNLTFEELDEATVRKSRSHSAPQVTVLSYGLGGSISNWSHNDNSYGFEYAQESIIEQIKVNASENSSKDVAILRVRTTFRKDFIEGTLSEETSVVAQDADEEHIGISSMQAKYSNLQIEDDDKKIQVYEYLTEPNNEKYIQNISSDGVIAEDIFNKHLVLIFDECYLQAPLEKASQYTKNKYIAEKYSSNDSVYAQLEFVLDVISYQYYCLTGELPTFNMIGHSRGGLLNMMYALGHPYNVASLYSIGTPYNGSLLGEMQWARELAGMDVTVNYKAEEQDLTTEEIEYEENLAPGIYDILNEDLYNSYKNAWNSHYDDWYDHIDFCPIGAYVDAGFILQALAEWITFEAESGVVKGLARTAALIVDGSAFYVVNTKAWGLRLV